jgi:site-specific recombinase XerD
MVILAAEPEATRMKLDLSLSQAIEGFLLDCASRRLSAHTVSDYATTFRRFVAFIGADIPLVDIDATTIRRFMAFLSTPQEGGGAVKKPPKPLSKKTSLNYHTGLSALWSWAVSEKLVERNVVREVEPPRPEQPAIVPFSRTDIKALLEACERTRGYSRPGKRICDNARPSALRDKTLILLLLDTGMRASEVCSITARTVDLKNKRIWVMGKGDKERSLPISAETAKALWAYMSSRSEAKASAPLFVTRDGRPMDRVVLLEMLSDLGTKAGVMDVHPHRFRHTFAINFLRNGGNVYELQMALGHTTLEMVRRYLALAETDLERAHEEASPVARWQLRA